MKAVARVLRWRVWPKTGGNALGVIEAADTSTAVVRAIALFGHDIIVVAAAGDSAVTHE